MMSQLVPTITLGLTGWLSGLLTLGFLIVCLVMILIVLIQRPQGGGLSAAFGAGAGSGQTAFGAKTGDALTIATIAIFIIFLLSAIGLNFAARPSEGTAAETAATAPADEAANQIADDAAAAADGVTDADEPATGAGTAEPENAAPESTGDDATTGEAQDPAADGETTGDG